MRAALWTALAAVLIAAAPVAGAQPRPKGTGSFGCSVAPMLDPTIPADASPPTSQATMNCFAWQQFIALNWEADTETCAASDVPASQFGEPNDASPVVWETYVRPEDVFLSGAAEPDPWCSDGGARKRLGANSKFAGAEPIDLSDFHEASKGGPWLVSQSKLLTMYEVRMNEDEFDYITDNELYNALVQASFAADPQKGINLPDGTTTTYGSVGAMEMKAAWLELPDPATWPRYKIARAQVTYPGQDPKTVTVGLVGLHIIHKTKNAQQFAWATFEHVDNVPDDDGSQQASYTYNDPGCSAEQCPPNQVPAPGDYTTPVQVVRENPLDSGVVQLNEAVQSMIADANPDSVFQNYELVNVLWPEASAPIPPGSRIPLTLGDATPTPPSQGGIEVVANTTMETYVQDTATCLDCHSNAPIASTTGETTLTLEVPDGSSAGTTGAAMPFAADYSFLLSRAQVPSQEEEDGGPSPVALLAIAAAGLAGIGAYAVRRRRAA